MTGVLLRIGFLCLVGGGAWLVAGWWQRRPRTGRMPLPAGVTLVTGSGCSLCRPAEQALRRAGVEPVVVAAGQVELPGPPLRSLPVALVVDGNGAVVMRRSGRAALDDAATLAACAAGVAKRA